MLPFSDRRFCWASRLVQSTLADKKREAGAPFSIWRAKEPEDEYDTLTALILSGFSLMAIFRAVAELAAAKTKMSLADALYVQMKMHPVEKRATVKFKKFPSFGVI